MKINKMLLFSLLVVNSVAIYPMNTNKDQIPDTEITIKQDVKKKKKKTKAKEVCCGTTCCYVFCCLGLCYGCNK